MTKKNPTNNTIPSKKKYFVINKHKVIAILHGVCPKQREIFD